MEGTSAFLSTYLCPCNPDIENFLKQKAIDFAKQGIAQTHLVVSDIDGNTELLGYFALANKTLDIPSAFLSQTYEKKVCKFGILDPIDKSYSVPLPLIAQLGKNYNKGLNEYLTGDELLKVACEKVTAIQSELGGRFVYIECEDKAVLTNFYLDNGFRRITDQDSEEESLLIRMIKYQ